MSGVNIHCMVQKASQKTRKMGRPQKFDETSVVDAAVIAFWRKGFDATTLGDLEEATGVDRSTLYNSFGGKSGLYERATDMYLTGAEQGLFAPLFDGTGDGLDDIAEVLRRLRHGLTNPDMPPGCLIVNDMALGPNEEPAARYRQLLEAGLRHALSRCDSFDEAEVERRTQLLASSIIGANIVSKTSGGNAEELGRLINAIAAEVESWRLNS